MNIGKLKERMVDYLDHNQQGLIIPSEISDGLFNIIDEAKKEFPMITDEKYRMYAQLRQYFELEQDRRSWFIKWFGFYFQPSMPQVVGGCAGHLDLSKVKPAPFVGTIIKEE